MLCNVNMCYNCQARLIFLEEPDEACRMVKRDLGMKGRLQSYFHHQVSQFILLVKELPCNKQEEYAVSEAAPFLYSTESITFIAINSTIVNEME